MPWLDLLWFKNPYINRLLPKKGSPVVAFAMQRMGERTGADSKAPGSNYNSRDFLSRFMTIKAQDPSIPDWFLTAWTASNVLAGSDTTAIMFRAIIYYLLKNPSSRQKLEAELAQARKENRLSRIVTWKESRELPYLDACIKEAGRIHPAIGLTLERVVPKGGAVICGKRFEEGTIVGMSPWVVHRDKHVFGEDADTWNPDRWLCEKERRTLMERSLLTVSYLNLEIPRCSIADSCGWLLTLSRAVRSWSSHLSREACLVLGGLQAGANFVFSVRCKCFNTAFMSMETLTKYHQMSLVNREREWELNNRWFVTQKGLDVQLKKRDTEM